MLLYYYIIDEDLVQPIMAENEEEALAEIRLRFGVSEANIITEARYKNDYSDRIYRELPIMK